MNYIHVSFIRKVMNAESRSKALSVSVLLKELVSRTFRVLLCAAPRDHGWFEAKDSGPLSQRQLWQYRLLKG
jgi:hypothetical protein